MEEWNVGILGVRAAIKHFNYKKLLYFNFVQDKLTHHFYPACPVSPAHLTGVKLFSISPGPLLQWGLPARALQWQAGRSPMFLRGYI